jgi:aminoacrylate peracid reductase
MPKVVVQPPRSAPPLAPYSPGILAGNTLYVSGMLAVGQDGDVVGIGDVEAQARCVLNAIRDVVEAAGGRMSDIVHNVIFLKDLGYYAKFNAVYRGYFPSEPPARYCVRADLVRAEFLVEVSSIAHITAPLRDGQP